MPTLIAISGGSCSGKTLLAETICSELRKHKLSVLTLSTDLFYKQPPPETPLIDYNFDSLESLDFKKLNMTLQLLENNQEDTIKVFEFRTHACTKDLFIYKADVAVIEGIFSFCEPEILKQSALSIFVDADETVMFNRRYERYYTTLKQPENFVLHKYHNQAQPFYRSAILPAKKEADIIVNGERPFGKTVELIVNYILNKKKALLSDNSKYKIKKNSFS